MTIWLTTIPIIALTIVALAVYSVWKINKEKKSGFPLEDERTAKIQGKAYKIGWFIGAFYLLALNFYNIISIEFLGREPLESMPVINSAVIIMGVSVIILITYYQRKENI